MSSTMFPHEWSEGMPKLKLEVGDVLYKKHGPITAFRIILDHYYLEIQGEWWYVWRNQDGDTGRTAEKSLINWSYK